MYTEIKYTYPSRSPPPRQEANDRLPGHFHLANSGLNEVLKHTP